VRWDCAACWTGSRMVVWGGDFLTDTGGVYDPVTDSWTATSMAGAPSARYLPTHVWTGTELIVWSGYTGQNFAPGGARYNPNTKTCTTMLTGIETHHLDYVTFTSLW